MLDRSALLLRTVSGALDLVRRHRHALDSLNVFPVADSDTGTNIWLTFGEAVAAVEELRARTGEHGEPRETSSDGATGAPAAPGTPLPPPDVLAGAIARGALLGARGNSGVILGQYLGELAVRLATPAHDGHDDRVGTGLGGDAVADALKAAGHAARRTVAQPVEGTVLTVADDAAASAAAAARDGADAAATVRAAVAEARRAVARTTTQLEALRGAEDAGGWGLVLLLEALAAAFGDPRDVVGPRPRAASGPAADPATPRTTGRTGGADGSADQHDRPGREPDPGPHEHPHGHRDVHGQAPPGADGEFELMAVARTDDARAVEALRTELVRLGQSVAVVGRSGLWQVHVHSDDVVGVVRALDAPGLGVRQVVVRHLLPAPPGRPTAGVVMVTRAPGLVAELARSSAVVVLAEGDADDEAVVRAVEDTGADDVLLLAHGSRRLPARLPEGTRVRLHDRLDPGHMVAAAAALTLVAPGTPAVDVRARVVRAVETVRTAVVDLGRTGTGRADDAGRVGGPRHDDVVDVARALLSAGDPAEVLTVVTSAGTPDPVVGVLREELGGTVEVVVIPGGAPGTALVLAAEPAQ